LLGLVNREKGYAWPSTELIASRLNLSVRTVKAAVAELERFDLFRVERNVAGRTSRYRPQFGKVRGANFAPEAVQILHSRGDENCTLSPAGPHKEREARSSEPRSKDGTKGTRIPENWQLSDADRAIAAGKGFSWDAIQFTAEKFRNYWLAKAGPSALKVDWSAAWRTWVINEKTRFAEAQSSAAPASLKLRERPRVASEDPRLSSDNWVKALEGFRMSRNWKPAWGPNPSQPGCFAPRELMEEVGVPFPTADKAQPPAASTLNPRIER
jgi:hypothetical protein